MDILFELFFTFAKIGAFTFGGGYAMIALLDHECVGNKGWITADELMEKSCRRSCSSSLQRGAALY